MIRERTERSRLSRKNSERSGTRDGDANETRPRRRVVPRLWQALAYAREGADVAIAYFNEHDDANETKHWVERAGRKALLIGADLADAKECERVVDERLERSFRVNVMAMFRIVRRALPHMKKGGAIINTSSIQAYQPKASILDYAATKGAIVAFTKGLAQEVIEKGLRANTVAPGPVWTPLIVQSFDEKKIADFGKESDMGRPAQPAELAPAYVSARV